MSLTREQQDALREGYAKYQRLFSTPDGRLVLEDLRQTYDGDGIFEHESPTTTAFRLGGRAVYRDILSILRQESLEDFINE